MLLILKLNSFPTVLADFATPKVLFWDTGIDRKVVHGSSKDTEVINEKITLESNCRCL